MIQSLSSQKVCVACHTPKSLGEFYAHPEMKDGFLNQCKECIKSFSKNHRIANAERYREYDRKRANDPERVAGRLAYASTEDGRAARRRANATYSRRNPGQSDKWRRANPNKWAAHWAVGYALKAGKLKKEPCGKCGNLKSHAHHEDYSKPLDVVWLCPLHHSERHKEMRRDGLNA